MSDQENDGNKVYVKVAKHGPYLVYGSPPCGQELIVRDDDEKSRTYREGKQFELPNPAALCRCGASENKPFCDGSHKNVDVDLAETASFEPMLDGAEIIPGPREDLADNESLCVHAGFCSVDGSAWDLVKQDGEEPQRILASITDHCPGGRLVLLNSETGAEIPQPMEVRVSILEDPQADQTASAIRLTGGIAVISASGREYQVRERVALCRCGASSNKPFCDGSHYDIGFDDGLM
ncbi:MAG: CDGSH-type Zn-finger protein [Actinomycetes bacterium]|jgi:CDGSH-type Zn-finger protein